MTNPAGAAPERLAEPAATAQATAEKTIHDLFNADYAKRDPADRSALAERFIREAVSEGDPTNRYILLCDARDLAASAGNYPTALRAIDRLATAYRVDAAAMRMAALSTAAKSATTPKAAGQIADGAMVAIEQAVREDNYEMALKLAPTAQTAAERARDPELLAHVSGRLREIQAFQGEYGRYKEGIKELASNANDSRANLAVGKFVAMIKGEWDRGLPYLAKSGDPALAAIARQDLAAPTDPDAQVKLADDWLALADKQPPGLKSAAQRRADHWYVLALPRLSGLQKLAAVKRIKDLPSSIDFEQLAVRVAAGLDRTNRSGAQQKPYGSTDRPESPGLLIGFDYTLNRFEGHLIVKSIRPIFLTASGKVSGKAYGKAHTDWLTIEARPGYAVGGVVTDGTNRFNGMRINFMRVHGTMLDPESAYESPWIGGHAAAKLDDLAGDGRPVVGIQLTSGEDIDTFGLIQAH